MLFAPQIPPEGRHCTNSSPQETPTDVSSVTECCLPLRYHLKDVIVGKIYFLLVRIKIKHMEIAIIKRETTGSGEGANDDAFITFRTLLLLLAATAGTKPVVLNLSLLAATAGTKPVVLNLLLLAATAGTKPDHELSDISVICVSGGESSRQVYNTGIRPASDSRVKNDSERGMNTG
uniref:(California timema) hypothetical protein n=1 Tax=Timema californicum TaxID=61474 RepID=A0A7R9P9M8_TIMCA|nr:unnamed protein product [Timema californicum]